jgi:hypothetical protein
MLRMVGFYQRLHPFFHGSLLYSWAYVPYARRWYEFAPCCSVMVYVTTSCCGLPWLGYLDEELQQKIRREVRKLKLPWLHLHWRNTAHVHTTEDSDVDTASPALERFASHDFDIQDFVGRGCQVSVRVDTCVLCSIARSKQLRIQRRAY